MYTYIYMYIYIYIYYKLIPNDVCNTGNKLST